jgi:hypothetical protein
MAEEWAPENEAANDPLEIMKESLAMQREMMAKARKLEEDEKERKKKYEESAGVVDGPFISFACPTLEQIVARQRKIWLAVSEALPNAPEAIQAIAFHFAQNCELDKEAGQAQ